MPRIVGVDQVVTRFNAIAGEKMVREVGQALYAAGEVIRADAAHLITEGAVSGAHHVPSIPYDPPNEDTGTLRAHIETTQPAPLRVEVSSNAPYAVPLEIGSSRMYPRPYMAPATERNRREVAAMIRDAVNRALKKGFGLVPVSPQLLLPAPSAPLLMLPPPSNPTAE